MDREADVVYRYDGSFEGFLCCVFESVYAHEIPFAILPHSSPMATLFPEKLIETDPAKARRVDASLPQKLGKGARSCVAHAFLSGSEEKELLILRFLRLGYRVGPGVLFMAGHKDVAPVLALEKEVCSEAHLLTGFVRFQDYGDFLGGTITPKHYVLPLLRLHFCQRLPGEDFILYDATHGAALLWQKGKASYAQLDEAPPFPEISREEASYQELWKRFYKTIAIAARENPALRRSLCPKRYWVNMTELKEEL